jgi:hypothetical protein
VLLTPVAVTKTPAQVRTSAFKAACTAAARASPSGSNEMRCAYQPMASASPGERSDHARVRPRLATQLTWGLVVLIEAHWLLLFAIDCVRENQVG